MTQNIKNNTASLLLDTGVGHQYDKEESYRYDISSSLSSSVPTGVSTSNEINLNGFSGRTPDGVCCRMTREENCHSGHSFHCHSGPRAGIQRDDKLMPKAFRIAQSGRSMVEMLGTLAIIGVLSVGGIAGYSYGMDKYRANTIINDIMLRAIDVNAQFDSTGDATLSEWPTTTVGKYTIGLENDTIGIQVEGVEKRLCEMVFDGMINNASIKIGAIEYDSATDDDVCGDTNTMVFYVDEAPLNTDNTENETNTGTMTTAITTTTTAITTTTTTVIKPETCTCRVGQYCADSNTSCYEANPSDTCVDAESQFKTVDIDGTTYYISNDQMSWWDAVSACEALGKSLINHNDITQTCNQADDTGCSSGGTKLNTLGDAIYDKGWGSSGGPWIWSSILYNSCGAYEVRLNDGYVSSNYRNGNGYNYDIYYDNSNRYAVCR